MKCRMLFIVLLFPSLMWAQGTKADYERALNLREKLQDLAINVPGNANAIENTSRFWYRKSIKGGNEFVVDAETLVKKPAFDHSKLAASLAAATSEKHTALTLPFQSITFVDNESAIEFTAAGSRWKCDLTSYACEKRGPAGQGQRGGAPEDFSGLEEYSGGFNNLTLEPAPQFQQQTGGQQSQAQNQEPKASPDGKWEAFIKNFNVYIRPNGKTTDEVALSADGSEGNSFTLTSLSWSPDSSKLAAYRVRPGFHRKIPYIESSPVDQVQPKYWIREYPKPGDTLDIRQPVLFDIAARKQFNVDNALFPNAYTMSDLVWWKDSRAFTFEYNQRGHQVFRIIEVSGATGTPRALVSDEPKTFFSYYGKKSRSDVNDGKEIIWMSERDGWNHLFLYDGATGRVKNQITKGAWVVRSVVKVDEQARQIYFQGSGMYPGKDPYLIHYYRVNFDGAGLTALTESDANHSVVFSTDMKYYVDTSSRADSAPVSQLRRTSDQQVLLEIERADISAALATGWQMPEVFSSIARDGKTDIWGIIVRPTNFDPTKKYPVIENIYAGPHSSFVPKTFSVVSGMQTLAELGFIVVQIDGMGTSNRSKAFHDVSWKNIGDAGFPDRILWHKAVAAKYPYYDITRVGIYGTSAGGQNSTGALLFHPDFYKVAVSAVGCHDNRMDKISWNEQWMSWPLGPHYAESSNVDNAHKLKGKLLLVVGELDTNVDPTSTLQVVNALIKADKKFDMLFIPGAGHGPGGAYGERLRNDFFVHHLLGLEPPDWNQIEAAPTNQQAGQRR